MPKDTLKNQVYEAMKEILPNHPEGIRASDLKKMIVKDKIPGEKPHSIGALSSLVTEIYPNEFYKQRIKGKGVFYFSVQNDAIDEEDDDIVQAAQFKEENFYDSFAEYLQYGDSDDENDHLDECTKAVSLGGNTRDKWGTPDVIGVLRYDYNDYVKFPDEIVSAEIKIDNASEVIITGFGQACAYRLFSHKTYLVIPELKDIRLTNRIEKLCQIFGIGLVYFDPKQDPNVSIYNLKLPAQKHSPDLFYMNEIIRTKDIDRKLYSISRK